MLYDPNWQQTKPDWRTLESLIAWLKAQPADRRYDYESATECLLAQYLRDHEPLFLAVGPWEASFVKGDGVRSERLPRGFDGISRYGRKTFGAALKRAQRRLAWRQGWIPCIKAVFA